jgi:hypothetical protein
MPTLRPAQNLFIVNPDTLVSGTRVAESFGCIRRAVLSERIKGVEINREMLFGTLLHELWDKAATKVGSLGFIYRNFVTMLGPAPKCCEVVPWCVPESNNDWCCASLIYKPRTAIVVDCCFVG